MERRVQLWDEHDLSVARLSASLGHVLCLLRVGSSTRAWCVDVHDLDYIALYSDMDIEAVESELGKIPALVTREHLEIHAQFVLGGIPVGISFQRLEDFQLRVDAILTGEDVAIRAASWAFAGDSPEVLCADIEDAVLISDPSGAASKLQSTVSIYPTTLTRGILEISLPELEERVSRCSQAVEVGDELAAEIALVLAVVPLARARSAIDRMYFRGAKRLGLYAKLYLPSLYDELLELVGGADISQRLARLRTAISDLTEVQARIVGGQ